MFAMYQLAGLRGKRDRKIYGVEKTTTMVVVADGLPPAALWRRAASAGGGPVVVLDGGVVGWARVSLGFPSQQHPLYRWPRATPSPN
jgi:hypothetical protein